MLRLLTFLSFSSLFLFTKAQVPSYGSPNKLDVACWNIEWFGDLSNGPSNDTGQFDNVLEVFMNSKIDIWGLSEISSNTAFNRLLDSLEGYTGVIAPINQTQKTALIYDTSRFNLLYEKLVITNQSYDFASGRFPFEVALIPKYGNPADTLICLVLHLKANVGNAAAKQESWQRRKNASGHLKNYIDQTHSTKKVIILGDFNDDTDISIYNGNTTPFANFLQDANNFQFLTTGLSASNTGSTVGRTDMVDHIAISNELFDDYDANSCKILPLQNFLSFYSSSTSDHYPVFASFSYQFTSLYSEGKNKLNLYPNPLLPHQRLRIPKSETVKVYNMQGQVIQPEMLTQIGAKRTAGVYILYYKYMDEWVSAKIQVK